MTQQRTERSVLDQFWQELVECHHDLHAVLRLIAERVCELVGDGCVITTVTEDGAALHPTVSFHTDPRAAQSLQAAIESGDTPLGEGIAGSVAVDRRSVILNDLPGEGRETTPEEYLSFVRTYPMRATMVVPMIAAGELVGTIAAIRTTSADRYTLADLRSLQALAERAALAVADAVASPRSVAGADFEALYRHNLDGVLVTTPDGHILAANPAACDILGLTERAIIQAGREGVVVADDPRLAQALAERSATGRVRAELTMRKGDGTVFTADLSSIVVTTTEQKVRSLVIFRDVSVAAAAREAARSRVAELEQAVQRDPLTGLWNRQGFAVAAEHLLASADREGRVVQVVFLDMDRLKELNDDQGHATGDAALGALGASIHEHVRESDVAGRLGGDEFALLLSDASAGDAADVVRRISDGLEKAGAPPGTTMSHGVVERLPADDATLHELLDAADRAMYQEKLLQRLRPKRPDDA